MSVTPLAGLPVFQGRIGQDARSGHYAVPRRYRLHLSTACPDGLRIAVTHSLLGLADICPAVCLPAVPHLTPPASTSSPTGSSPSSRNRACSAPSTRARRSATTWASPTPTQRVPRKWPRADP